MKKVFLTGLCIVMLLGFSGCEKKAEVTLQNPKGEWIEVSNKKAKEFIEALEKLELVEFEPWNEEQMYGSLPYRFMIKTEDGESSIQLMDLGIINYNGTYYIQSKFEEIFDIARQLYIGVNDVLYETEGYLLFQMYPYKYEHVFYGDKLYYEKEIIVDGSCNLKEVAGWYDDTVGYDMSIEELFNMEPELNSVIEIKGTYTYTFKKISDFENVYLLKCDGPTIEEPMLEN